MASRLHGLAHRCGWRAGFALAALAAALPAHGGEHPPSLVGEEEPMLSIVRWVELAPEAAGGGTGSVVARSLVYADGSSEEGLWVSVEGLSPAVSYQLVLDGAVAAALATDADGRGAVALLSEDAVFGNPSAPAISPVNRIGSVAVRRSDGPRVLSGDLREARLRVWASPADTRPCD